MSLSPDEKLRSEVIELAESCLQGTAGAAQVARLEELFQTHPNARRYYLAFVQDSYSLRIWAMAQVEKSSSQLDPLAAQAAERVGSPIKSKSAASRTTKTKKLVQRGLLVAAGLAAVVMLTIRLVPVAGPADGLLTDRAVTDRAVVDRAVVDRAVVDRAVVAAIIDVQGGVWSGDRPLTDGSSLHETERLQLDAGVARIRFRDGASVTLQGPVDLQLVSAGGAHLHSGLLTSFVPPQAVGFQVQTDALNVVDLGTSFGVAVTEDGQTSVSVFSGRVEVSRPDSSETSAKIVNQGESVSTSIEQASIESTEFTADQYDQSLKATNGIVSTDGKCRFLAQQAVGGMLPEDNEQILVALEARDVVLRRELVANFVPKPDGEGLAQGKTAPIAAGTRVDCFLVQFRPEPEAIPKLGTSAAGRITFDRPILGLIARNASLTQTDKLFAGGKTGIKQPLRGGESGENVGDRERDTLVMSEDRRTIEVTAKLRKHMDQVRVLVRATDGLLDSTIQTSDRDSDQ